MSGNAIEEILRIRDEATAQLQRVAAEAGAAGDALKRARDEGDKVSELGDQFAKIAQKIEGAKGRLEQLGASGDPIEQIAIRTRALKKEIADLEAMTGDSATAAKARAAVDGQAAAAIDKVTGASKAATGATEKVTDTSKAAVGATKELTGATDDGTKANWQAVQGAQSLKKNLGDVFDSLVAGQSPMHVLIQQGPALAESLTMGGDAAEVLEAAFGGLWSAAKALTGVVDEADESLGGAKGALDGAKGALDEAEGYIGTAESAFGEFSAAASGAGISVAVAASAISIALAATAAIYSVAANASMSVKQESIDLALELSTLADRTKLSADTVDKLAASWGGFEDVAKKAQTDIDVLTGKMTAIQAAGNAATQVAIDAAREQILADAARVAALKQSIAANQELIDTEGSGRAVTVQAIEDRNRQTGELVTANAALKEHKAALAVVVDQIAQKTEYDNLSKLAQDKATAATEAATKAEKARAEAEKERAVWLRRMKEEIESFQAAEELLAQAIMTNDSIAQENARYKEYVEQIKEAINRTGDLVNGKIALNEAEKEHIRLLGLAMQSEDPDTRAAMTNQGPEWQATLPAAAGTTGIDAFNQATSAASSLGGLTGLDPTGISSAVVAGMQAVADIGSGGGVLGQADELLDGFAKGLPNLGPAVSDFIGSVLTDSVPAIVGSLDELVGGLVDMVPDIILAMIEMVPELIDALIEMVPNLISALIGAIPEITFAVLEAIPGVVFALVMGVVDALKEGIHDLLHPLKKDRPGFFKEGGLLDRLVGGADKDPIKDFVAALPSYDIGTPYVPQNQVAQLHKGEGVLTAEENAAYRMGGSGGGLTINAPMLTPGGARDFMRQMKRYQGGGGPAGGWNP